MKTTWIEVTCDNCHTAFNHFRPGGVDSQIRQCGGVVTNSGKHFCDRDCYLEYRKDRDHE